MSHDDLLTTAQAGTALGIGPSRVQQLVRAGRIKARRIGRMYLIRRADLAPVMSRPAGRPRTKPDHD